MLLSFSLLLSNAGWFNLLTMSCWVFSLILIFRSLGVLVHANAANLGLPVRFSAEIEAAQINENERRALSDFALSLYQQVEAHRVNEAFARYQSRIAEDKFKSEEALWDIIRERSNPALAIRAGQGLIERLVKAGNLRDAWQVLIYCFEKMTSSTVSPVVIARYNSRQQLPIQRKS